MRPSMYDTNQPHHAIAEDTEGRWHPHCSCGYSRQGYNHRMTTYLSEHIRDAFDGRCHYKRYGMECLRYYGHRGIHAHGPHC